MIDYVTRYQKVLKKFTELNIHAFMVSNPKNIRYLTGLVISDGELVLTASGSVLFVDSRYLLEAQQNKFDFDVKVFQFKDKFEEISDWLRNGYFRNIGIESGFVPYHTFVKWQEKISGQLFPCEDVIEKVRIHKDNFEIQLIQRAIDIVARVTEKVPGILENSIGLTEKEVCLEIEYLIKKEGAERLAFDIIVATGERSAMPHAAPSDKKIRTGEVVLIDMGAVFEGYHSDLTRVFFSWEEKRRGGRHI